MVTVAMAPFMHVVFEGRRKKSDGAREPFFMLMSWLKFTASEEAWDLTSGKRAAEFCF